jgi:hypothetical protein
MLPRMNSLQARGVNISYVFSSSTWALEPKVEVRSGGVVCLSAVDDRRVAE